MNKQSQQLLIMLLAGIAIGAIGLSFIDSGPKTQPAGNKQESLTGVSSTTNQLMPGNAAGAATNSDVTIFANVLHIPANSRKGLLVSDQNPGFKVVVSDLDLPEPHWVAVYEDDVGKPGWILGAIRTHPGENTVVVELLRAIVKGNTYYAAILNDDGNDTFNRLSDLPPLSPEKVQIVSFKVK